MTGDFCLLILLTIRLRRNLEQGMLQKQDHSKERLEQFLKRQKLY